MTLLFGWVLATSVSPSLGAVTVSAPPGSLSQCAMALIATGRVIFGLASQRTAVDSPTRFLLLGDPLPWFVILAVPPVRGSDLSGGLRLAESRVLPFVLPATG